MTINEVLLRRKHKIYIHNFIFPVGVNQNSLRYVASIQKNIQSLGFTFSPETIQMLAAFDCANLISFYDALISQLKQLVGADVIYRPMYRGFPHEVMAMDEVQLYFNAIVHYLSNGTLVPFSENPERAPLVDNLFIDVNGNVTQTNLTSLTFGKEVDLEWLLTALTTSKTSLSTQDKSDIEYLLNFSPELYDSIPLEIPFKETAIFVSKLLYDKGNIEDAVYFLKTPTDVLRFAAALSDSDISLSDTIKFRHFSQKERRVLMEVIERILHKCSLEEIYQYKGLWLTLGEILHPGDKKYVARFAFTQRMFSMLRNENKPLFSGGVIETSIAKGDVDIALLHLQKNPGDFARRLDKLLRVSKYPNQILTDFSNVAERVSTPVLLQAYKHFKEYHGLSSRLDKRVFFPKGNVGKVAMIDNDRPPLEAYICACVCTICENALKQQYAKREPWGNVYIDPLMDKYIVPFSQRSATSGTRCLTRGSRIGISDKTNTIRSFIWWTNTKEGHRVDLDLSACLLDDDFNYVTHISYTNLKDGSIRSCHSGDIVNGGPANGVGVAEFIDIDIQSALKKGRYVCFSVHNYTGQTFDRLPNCRFGWMERQDVNTGEIFEPSTVKNVITPTSNITTSIPILFDLLNYEFIWLDMAGGDFSSFRCNNIENNASKIQKVCYALVHCTKPTMGELMKLNAAARGNLVQTREEADIIFSPDTTPAYTEEGVETPIITPYDLEFVMSELL